MNLSIPIYVEEHKVPGDPAPQFHLRPLFFPAPAKAGRQLSAATSKLAQAIRTELDALASRPRMEPLIPWTFSPPLTERNVKFTLRLRRQTAECRFLVVSFEAFGDRRLAFTPSLPDLYFECLRGQDLAARAEEVITDHYRKLEKDEDFELPEQLTTYARAWVTTLDLDVRPNPSLERPTAGNLLALVSQSKMDGRAELTKVGRCLDWLYPDDLDRAVLRDAEADELTRLLAERDKRPVLLLGPRKVGKTALVHEAVFRRVSARETGAHVADRNVWLLAPQRLISGMSYVGQWEGRLLAILKHAAKRDHVLYVDDVLGLYAAGQSADSDLSVAAVLRPFIERRDVRLLAEMTPDAHRVLRERDRGLADLFHVLPLREPTGPQTRRILIHVQRRLEDRHRCRFDLSVLPAATDLQQRYVRDQSMPGKAAAFLGQLAWKFRQQDVTRQTVLGEFQSRSGLSVAFLDQAQRLDRAAVVKALGNDIVGQSAALDAMADVVAIGKARLNDPTRPLGTFLFLGPTGVGKTAAAKALARYLYGDEARLVRFDMNEYLDPASPARLTGTFSQPEGLLTAAVRRQPYCVLLLDEIEKAHPAVFDLLLQVLGEGRLTDALGRTSDFTSAVVILTSNLGAREAQQSFGLRPAAEPSRAAAYTDAAKKFFRPEFFNRLDRLVPFEPLGRPQIAAIADKLIADLFRREGLVHRRCVLDVDAAAMDCIVAEGYHPQLGARALKRAVERQLTQPIAAKLATLAPDAPTVIRIEPAADGGIAPIVQPLINAPPIPPALSPTDLADADAVLDRVEDFLDEVETANAANETAPRVSADALSPQHFRYFAVREQIAKLDRMLDAIDQAAHRAPNTRRSGPRVPPQRRIKVVAKPPAEYAKLLATGDPRTTLAQLADDARPLGEQLADRLLELAHECALLESLRTEGRADRILLTLRPLGSRRSAVELLGKLAEAYANLFPKNLGFTATRLTTTDNTHQLILEMPGVESALAAECGTHLLFPPGDNVLPVSLTITPLPEGAAPPQPACAQPLGQVLRLYDPDSATLDLRTGLLCEGLPTGDDLRRLILATLPVPL